MWLKIGLCPRTQPMGNCLKGIITPWADTWFIHCLYMTQGKGPIFFEELRKPQMSLQQLLRKENATKVSRMVESCDSLPKRFSLTPTQVAQQHLHPEKYTLLLVSACKWNWRCLSGRQREKSPLNRLVTCSSSLYLQLPESSSWVQEGWFYCTALKYCDWCCGF